MEGPWEPGVRKGIDKLLVLVLPITTISLFVLSFIIIMITSTYTTTTTTTTAATTTTTTTAAATTTTTNHSTQLSLLLVTLGATQRDPTPRIRI